MYRAWQEYQKRESEFYKSKKQAKKNVLKTLKRIELQIKRSQNPAYIIMKLIKSQYPNLIEKIKND